MATTGEPPLVHGPYKGLAPYAEDDAPFFFGREPECELIAANLQAYRLTLLYGESGVGKSSVLRAGVAHQLRQLSDGNLVEQGTREIVVVVCAVWRDDPVISIDATIAASVRDDAVVRPDTAGRPFLDMLCAWTDALDSDLLFIFDQFEDYFLYHPADTTENTFDAEFAQAINAPDLRANFLIAVREDSLARLDRFKGRIPRLFDNYLRIRPLDRDAAREAIENPIAAFNERGAPGAPAIEIDAELTRAVLDQVRTGQVRLETSGAGTAAAADSVDSGHIEAPYLQLVMTRVWREAQSEGSTRLRRETLDRLGGANRIVRTHLDEVMSALTMSEQRTIARAVRYLVTPSGVKIAHSIADLADYADVPKEQLDAIAEKLSSGAIRILRPVVAPGDRTAPPRYEIFHDALAPAVLDWRQRTESARRLQTSQGLEPLHRRARSATWYLLGGALLLVVPFMVAISDRQTAQALWLWATLAGLSSIFLFATSIKLVSIWRRILVATELGFPGSAIFDVLIDDRGEVGAVASGAGIYGQLDVRERQKLLKSRRMKAAALFAAPVALLAWVLVAVLLGSRQIINQQDAEGVAWLIALVTFGVWAWASIRANWMVQRARRHARKQLRTRGSATPARLWMADVDQFAPDDGNLISGRRTRRMTLSLGLAMIVAAAAFYVVFSALFTSFVASEYVAQFLNWLRDDATVEMLPLAEIARPYRLDVDPSISALEAGESYYALGSAGRLDLPQQSDAKPRRPIPQPFASGRVSPPFETSEGELNLAAFEGLVARAARGFTEQERAYLADLSSHPALREIELLSKAPAMDMLAAQWTTVPRAGLFVLDQGDLKQLRSAALAQVAKAALAVSERRNGDAEVAIRQLISLGVLVHDNAHSILEPLIAFNLIDTGLKALEDLFTIVGRTAEASSLKANREVLKSRGEAGRAQPFEARPRRSLSEMRLFAVEMLRDPNRSAGSRWESFTSLAFVPCTTVRELVFGSDRAFEQGLDTAEAALGKTDLERQVLNRVRSLDLLRDSFSEEPIGRFLSALRVPGRLLGNPRMERCPALLLLWARY